MIERLQELGLTKNESIIYSTLLKTGRTTAGKIIKETNLHRNIVYFNLDKLIEKSLVTYVLIENVRYFETEKPEELKNYIDRKKQEALKKEKIVNKILPEIENKRKVLPQNQDASVYKGIRSVKMLFNEATKTKDKKIYLFATGWGAKKTLGKFLYIFHKKIRYNKIDFKAVANKGVSFDPKEYPYDMKFLDSKNVIPTTIMLFDNKVLNIIWGDNPISILIKSKPVYDTYKNYFDELWSQAKYLK